MRRTQLGQCQADHGHEEDVLRSGFVDEGREYGQPDLGGELGGHRHGQRHRGVGLREAAAFHHHRLERREDKVRLHREYHPQARDYEAPVVSQIQVLGWQDFLKPVTKIFDLSKLE